MEIIIWIIVYLIGIIPAYIIIAYVNDNFGDYLSGNNNGFIIIFSWFIVALWIWSMFGFLLCKFKSPSLKQFKKNNK